MNIGLTSKGEPCPLSLDHRLKHVYVAGKTGQGKSVLLENMMIEDLAEGRGFAFFDPHGTSARRVASAVPKHRMNDVIYFDPTADTPITFNPLHCVPEKRALIAEQFITTLHNLYPLSWGANLEYILLNTLRLLLENPGTTLADLKRVLVDDRFRASLLTNVTDEDLRRVWEDEFGGKERRQWNEEIRSTLNKVGRFTSVPALKNVLGAHSSVDLKEIMDRQKVLICDLSLGRVGRTPARLLGGLFVSGFAQTAETREDTDLPQFTLYIDECQNFITETFDTTLSEARKWKLSLVLANQYISQLPDDLRDAILGNAGTLISFQVGHKTAQHLAPEFDKTPHQLTTLDKYTAWVKLPEHDARVVYTNAPMKSKRDTFAAVVANTRSRYTKPLRAKQTPALVPQW